MKRRIVFVMAGLLLMLVLVAGCVAPAATTGAEQSGTSSGEDITLTFMHWGSTAEKQAIDDTIAAYEAEHPNVHIETLYTPDDYATKLNTLMAAGDLPDLFHMSEGPAIQWAEQGRIMDMTPYLAEYPSFANRLPQTFYYFAPGQTHGTMNAAEIALLFYNKPAFEAAGVDLPPASADTAWTWDQFVDVAKQLTLDSSGRNAADPAFDPGNIVQYGVSVPRWWMFWYPFVRSAGGDITNADGTEFTLNSPEAIQVFQNLQDLIWVHHVAPTPTQDQNLPATFSRLQTGQVAMQLDGQWALQELSENDVDFGIGVLPKIIDPVTVVVGSITAISAETEHPQEAIDFWLFHNDPEQAPRMYQTGLMMPLEDKYYTDPEFIAKWAENEWHPAEYKTAAIDYMKNNAVVSPVNLKNFAEIDAAIGAGLDPLWLNEAPAQEVLDNLATVIQPLLQGKYPTE